MDRGRAGDSCAGDDGGPGRDYCHARPAEVLPWYRQLGERALSDRDFQLSTVCFQRLLAEEPEDPANEFGLAVSLAGVGRQREASELFAHLLRPISPAMCLPACSSRNNCSPPRREPRRWSIVPSRICCECSIRSLLMRRLTRPCNDLRGAGKMGNVQIPFGALWGTSPRVGSQVAGDKGAPRSEAEVNAEKICILIICKCLSAIRTTVAEMPVTRKECVKNITAFFLHSLWHRVLCME